MPDVGHVTEVWLVAGIDNSKVGSGLNFNF